MYFIFDLTFLLQSCFRFKKYRRNNFNFILWSRQNRVFFKRSDIKWVPICHNIYFSSILGAHYVSKFFIIIIFFWKIVSMYFVWIFDIYIFIHFRVQIRYKTLCISSLFRWFIFLLRKRFAKKLFFARNIWLNDWK